VRATAVTACMLVSKRNRGPKICRRAVPHAVPLQPHRRRISDAVALYVSTAHAEEEVQTCQGRTAWNHTWPTIFCHLFAILLFRSLDRCVGTCVQSESAQSDSDKDAARDERRHRQTRNKRAGKNRKTRDRGRGRQGRGRIHCASMGLSLRRSSEPSAHRTTSLSSATSLLGPPSVRATQKCM
jgi:hypothetical protein